MRERRTKIDFSKHEVHVIKNDEVLIHHLKVPGTYWDSIKYINCHGIMAVTGDYGNWIFCREFHPSADGYVSDGYWHEKLKIASEQEGTEFDSNATKEAINEKLNEYKLQCSEDGKEPDEEIVEYYEECMNKCDDHELDYTHYAYREQPSELDYDDVIFIKDYKYWLKGVFDEMCRRMNEEETKEQ